MSETAYQDLVLKMLFNWGWRNRIHSVSVLEWFHPVHTNLILGDRHLREDTAFWVTFLTKLHRDESPNRAPVAKTEPEEDSEWI